MLRPKPAGGCAGPAALWAVAWARAAGARAACRGQTPGCALALRVGGARGWCGVLTRGGTGWVSEARGAEGEGRMPRAPPAAQARLSLAAPHRPALGLRRILESNRLSRRDVSAPPPLPAAFSCLEPFHTPSSRHVLSPPLAPSGFGSSVLPLHEPPLSVVIVTSQRDSPVEPSPPP